MVCTQESAIITLDDVHLQASWEATWWRPLRSLRPGPPGSSPSAFPTTSGSPATLCLPSSPLALFLRYTFCHCGYCQCCSRSIVNALLGFSILLTAHSGQWGCPLGIRNSLGLAPGDKESTGGAPWGIRNPSGVPLGHVGLWVTNGCPPSLVLGHQPCYLCCLGC